MITIHARIGNRLIRQRLTEDMAMPPETVWIDLHEPTEAERRQIASALAIDLPTREEMKEIEASSQLYVEDGCIYLTTPLINQVETSHPEHGELTFVLAPRHLVTMRYTNPRSFATFVARAQRQLDLMATPEDVLLGLLDAVIDRLADVLELIGARIDALSSQVFEASARTDAAGSSGGSRRAGARKPRTLQEVLSAIGRAGDLNHKVRASLAGLNRLMAFFGTVSQARLTKDQKLQVKTLTRDLRSLNEQAGFLAQEANFLLDASLGLINIEQNNIVKIMSVAAVAFLPPTLIASIYGMNFRFMPELTWAYGYPVAIGLMALSAIIPIIYFLRKGWL